MEEEMAGLRRELEEAKEDLLLKTDEYNELVSASAMIEAELERDLQEVEQKAERWRQQAQRFEDEVREAREKMATHFRESATIQRELDKTKEKLHELTREKTKWETEVDHLSTQVRILEASNEDLKHQLEKALEDKVFLQSDYDEIEKEHELSSERFRSEILDLKSELFAVKLKQNVDVPRVSDGEDRESLRESFLSVVMEENPFRPSLSLERDMEENEKHIQLLQEELRELGNRLHEEEDRREELEAQLVEMHDRQAHMEAMEVEISEMSDELIYKAEQIKRAENEVTCLQTKLSFALASVEAMLSSTKEQHEIELDELKKKLEESKSMASNQEESFHQLSVLRAEYSQVEASYAQARAQIELERAKYSQLTEELNQSKCATEAVQQELEDIRQQYEDLQKEHEESMKRSQTPTLRPTRSRSIDGNSNEIAQKYLQERKRNAMLLSKLQNATGNMQVLCRVRPLLPHDPSYNGGEMSVDVLNLTDVAAMEMKADHEDLDAPWKVFSFDRVFGPQSTQMDVFREVEPIAHAVIDGFKACIFAYGQTGSGKTYTMEGSENQPGLNHRILSHVFESISLRGTVVADAKSFTAFEENQDQIAYHVQVGVFEIYNETIRDLLHPNHPNLDIRTDEYGDVGVPGLHMETTYNPNHAMDILSQAQKNRASCSTNVHSNSSRSHSIVVFQMKSNSGLRGTLHLVDLAGSERVKISGDHVLKETAAINKSLSALGDVMEALDKKNTHVPYRNSKLTYALQDVLGSSQCKTVMILNVAPGISTASETYRSMQFAERARRIVFAPNGIKPRQRGLLSGKQAFTEIKSLKSQVAAANTKLMQVNQTIASMKREHKMEQEKLSSLLEQKSRALDEAKSLVQTLKASNAELTEKLKEEKDLRLQELAQSELEQKQRRQLQSKTKVSAAHKESLEKMLFDRENEVVKLRHSLNEARRRSQNTLIPRLSLENNNQQQNPLDGFKSMTVEEPVSSASETELESESSDKPIPSRIPQRVSRRTTFPQDQNDEDAPVKRKAVSALRVPVSVPPVEGASRKQVQSSTESKSKIPRRTFGKQSPREDNQISSGSKQSTFKRIWK